MMLLLSSAITYAQTVPDPISGGAGWLGAGLLGVLLGWLCLVHLPNKDKQIERLMTACDTQINGIVDRFDKAQEASRVCFDKNMSDARLEFRTALDQISTQHSKQLSTVLEAFHKELNTMHARSDSGARRENEV